jgi:hypothetical protein
MRVPAGFALAALIGLNVHTAAADTLYGLSCDGRNDLITLVQDFNTGSWAWLHGVRVIDVRNVRTIRAGENLIQCQGVFVDGNQGFRFPMFWTFYLNSMDQVVTGFQLTGR